MSRQGFYFDNMFRAYPLVNSPVGMTLPDEVIVDFNCSINSDAGFVDGTHKVWLYAVSRSNNQITFAFACDAPALNDKLLTFKVQEGCGELTYAFSELKPISSACPVISSSSEVHVTTGYTSNSSSSSVGSDFELASYTVWDGFIVVGKLTSLLESLGQFECMTDPEGYTKVEPSLVINLQNTAVRSVSIANKLPTTVTAPDGCSDGVEQSYDIITYHRGITGNIRFINGYSCNISISESDNSILFTATVDGATEGQFCGHEEATKIKYKSQLIPGVKFGKDHVIPDYSVLYSGGPTCKDTLKSINGIGGKRLWIIAGRGIALTEDQENYLISINATLSGLAICSSPGSNNSVSVSSAVL